MKAGVHEGLRRTAALAAILFLTAGTPYASIVHAQDAQGYVESYVPADIAGSAAGSPYADNIASDIIEPPVISGALMAGEALLETPEGSEPTRTRLLITRGTTDIGKAILRRETPALADRGHRHPDAPSLDEPQCPPLPLLTLTHARAPPMAMRRVDPKTPCCIRLQRRPKTEPPGSGIVIHGAA